MQIWTTIGAWVWFAGAAVLLIYGVVSFFILKRNVGEAAHVEANIYESATIKSPFVLGVFAPRIYLPIGLSEQEKSYIVLHEQTHIRRHDHIVKFAAYFVLCLHWFNPLAWAAFLLMGRDMEMSCDERVLKEMGGETKKGYSLSLLSLATERRIIGVSPLAFGEDGIKERIKNVLNFKKTSRVIIIAAVALVAVLSIGFALNKTNNASYMNYSEKTYYLENVTESDKPLSIFYVTLYNNGTAEFPTPKVSSYTLPKYPYTISGDKLLIHDIFETGEPGKGLNNSDGKVIATFNIVDNNTLIFVSGTWPLLIEEGARYVCTYSGSVPPSLDVVLRAGDGSEQQVRAAQLTYGWHGVDENGNDFGIESDSVHPLQLDFANGYEAITLFQSNTTNGDVISSSEIVMQFSDDYPPLSVSVQRWDAMHAGTGSEVENFFDKGEPVEIFANTYLAVDDEHDYIYEVYANWAEGNSYYAFRVVR
jgi:hypothetical protein